MKKKLTAVLALVLTIVVFASGVFAAGTITKIQAYLNKSMDIKVDGTVIQPKETDGSRIYPIVYNGRTFVPAKAIAEALGATVDYDNSGNGTVIINSSDDSAGRPVNDANSGNTSTTPKDNTSTPGNTTTAPTTTATGSLSSPIPMNQKFTWSSTYTYKDTSYSGTYSATLKSAKKISADDVRALDVRISDDDAGKFDFVLVTLAWEVKDAKCISASSSIPYMYLSQFGPDIWGSETSDNTKYIIGGIDYGFDEAITEKVNAATNLKKLQIGESGSFSAEGQFVIPVTKNKTNYLVIKDDGIGMTDYDKSKIHFKLN